jgi:pilus assembly protein CpaE
MTENIISVRLEIKSQKVKEKLAEIISSIEEFRVIGEHDTPRSSDLLILEVGEDLKREFERIHALVDSGVAAEVFLTSARSEPEILIQALRAGIKEFLSQPLHAEEVKEALLRFKDRQKKPDKKNKRNGEIIDVVGSKGGVGGTTVAVNLATSLIELEGVTSVALVDMDAQCGEIQLFLEMKPEPHYNWGEITRNISRLDDTFLMSILSKHPSGVYLLPAPDPLRESVEISKEDLDKTMRLMRTIFDFVVIDSGQLPNEISRWILDISDAILLISVLTLPSLASTKRLLNQLERAGYGLEDVKLIINRYLEKSEISLKEVEKTLGRAPFWLIPNDYRTAMSALNQGKPLAEVSYKAEISKNFRQLAATFIDIRRGGEKREKTWFFRR